MCLVRLAFAAGLMCASSACAPYIGTCAWLDLSGNDALRVVEPRVVTEPQKCDCAQCAAPGQFEIRRPRYTLEFWNGDRWYPALLARARDDGGAPLVLQSDQLQAVASSSLKGK